MIAPDPRESMPPARPEAEDTLALKAKQEGENREISTNKLMETKIQKHDQ